MIILFIRSLVFDPVSCRIDHEGKSLATLNWEAVTALKLVNKPFGLASIFLEVSRRSPKGNRTCNMSPPLLQFLIGANLSYVYAEFDNKHAGKLEGALETAIPKVVRKQDVPEWLQSSLRHHCGISTDYSV